MLNDDQVTRALRAAIPRANLAAPSRDVWPSIVERTNRSPRWSLADWSAAAIVVVALLLFPKWFWFLAYHL